MHRIYLAFLCFFRVLLGRPLPAEVRPAEVLPAAPPPTALAAAPVAPVLPEPKAPPRPDPGPGALQLLGLLQREGRLVDFLTEAIDGYDDAAIGAAVRDIHRGCRKVVVEHFAVAPVIETAENEACTVDAGFDPGRIRLTGNVTGEPPFHGVLRHRGWRAARVSLPILADGVDPAIVAPAEVELA